MLYCGPGPDFSSSDSISTADFPTHMKTVQSVPSCIPDNEAHEPAWHRRAGPYSMEPPEKVVVGFPDNFGE